MVRKIGKSPALAAGYGEDKDQEKSKVACYERVAEYIKSDNYTRSSMKLKKYKGTFKCDETGEETEHEFEDWIGDDGKLVCSIDQVVEDWAYEFYDKGPFTTVTFEELTLEEQEYELSHQIIRAAENYDWQKNSISTLFEGYYYNIFLDLFTGNWHIQVSCVEDEEYLFSGWWNNSKDKNIRAALVEAIRHAGVLD